MRIALRTLYATDASEYEELPLAVVLPRSEADVSAVLTFARQHALGLIPRAAGTSLAGQVVGSGIVSTSAAISTGSSRSIRRGAGCESNQG